MDQVFFWRESGKKEILREAYFLAVALILAFGTLQTTGTALNTEKPVVSVVSCSMYPGPGEEGLHKGDILVVKGTPFEEINEKDTIVYDVPDRIDFTVNGDDYSLVTNKSVRRPSADTSAGKISLISAVQGPNQTDRALLEINGVRKPVTEGKRYGIEGTQMTLEAKRIDSMPIPVVHRVEKKYEDSLETKGINNPSQLDFEKDVRPEQIHGKVSFVIPRIGLLKIVAMDLVGFNGGEPLKLENSQLCEVRA